MVTDPNRVRDAIAAVIDPELRVLSIAELGILREVRVDPDGTTTVTITPTYTGCPAMASIRTDIRAAARTAGCERIVINTVFFPAWTTSWLSETARQKLAGAGIAPPASPSSAVSAGKRLLPLASAPPRCPRCGSADTGEISRFGSTACRALWRCTSCREPFDRMKEH
jgi:ring-1,2-phenylacetyl-CoA epoxidase subunit PaaD